MNGIGGGGARQANYTKYFRGGFWGKQYGIQTYGNNQDMKNTQEDSHLQVRFIYFLCTYSAKTERRNVTWPKLPPPPPNNSKDFFSIE